MNKKVWQGRRSETGTDGREEKEGKKMESWECVYTPRSLIAAVSHANVP